MGFLLLLKLLFLLFFGAVFIRGRKSSSTFSSPGSKDGSDIQPVQFILCADWCGKSFCSLTSWITYGGLQLIEINEVTVSETGKVAGRTDPTEARLFFFSRPFRGPACCHTVSQWSALTLKGSLFS